MSDKLNLPFSDETHTHKALEQQNSNYHYLMYNNKIGIYCLYKYMYIYIFTLDNKVLTLHYYSEHWVLDFPSLINSTNLTDIKQIVAKASTLKYYPSFMWSGVYPFPNCTTL